MRGRRDGTDGETLPMHQTTTDHEPESREPDSQEQCLSLSATSLCRRQQQEDGGIRDPAFTLLSRTLTVKHRRRRHSHRLPPDERRGTAATGKTSSSIIRISRLKQ